MTNYTKSEQTKDTKQAPVAMIKCGEHLIKIYDKGEDFQAIISGDVKFPELWFSKHWDKHYRDALQYAIDKSITYNHIAHLPERIK